MPGWLHSSTIVAEGLAQNVLVCLPARHLRLMRTVLTTAVGWSLRGQANTVCQVSLTVIVHCMCAHAYVSSKFGGVFYDTAIWRHA